MTDIISTALDKFAPAMAEAQSKMPVIGFDASANATRTRSYRYATLGAIIDAVRPILAEHGFSVIQQVVSSDDGTAVGVRTTLLHTSGQYMTWKNVIKLDMNAHNVGQEAGKLITYLRRYSLAAALNLYADEDTDNSKDDRITRQDIQNANPSEEPIDGEPEALKSRPVFTPAKLKKKLAVTAGSSNVGNQAVMQKVAMNLGELCGGDDEIRHKVQKYLFGTDSLTMVSPQMWTAALAWLSPFQNENGEWQVSDIVKTEVKQVIEKVANE